MFKVSTCFIFTFTATMLSGQEVSFPLGARQAAIGGTSSTLNDAWCLFNNIGGLGSINSSQVFASYQNRYGISAFQSIGSGYIQKLKWGNTGIGFYRFGDDLFNLQKLNLAVGNKIQMVSLGLSVNFVQYRVESQDTRSAIAFDFGGIAAIIPSLQFGAFISNINQAEIPNHNSIPVLMKSGLSYRPSKELMINAEVEKEIDKKENLKFGLEYNLQKLILIRTGINTLSDSMTFGFGLFTGQFNVDYAFSHQSTLGGIHEISIIYKIKSSG